MTLNHDALSMIKNQKKSFHFYSLNLPQSFRDSDNLKLALHPRKIYLQHYSKGVTFLGAHIRPHCIVAGKRLKGNFYDAIMRHNQLVQERKPTKEEQAAFLCSMNSYLGIMKHYNNYRFRKKMLIKHVSIWWWNIMYCSGGCTKVVSKQRKTR